MKTKSLALVDRIAEKAHPALGVAQRQQHAAELRGGDEAAHEIGEPERRPTEAMIEPEPGRRRVQVEAEDVLEVGQAVIAAEPHVVAEEGEHSA